MAKNLYDILEVSQSASQEAIEAAYKRLHSKYSELAGGGDEDATNHLIGLREAYKTLASPEPRGKYDEQLEAKQLTAISEPQPTHTLGRNLVLLSVIAVCGLGFAKYQSEQEKARLAREQAITTAKIAEIEAQREREEKLAITQAEQQRLREEATARQNRERDLAYSSQVSREVERAENQARIERERAERQRVEAERQRQYEYERQLTREKNLARQMEQERYRNRY